MKIQYILGIILVAVLIVLTGCQQEESNTINVAGDAQLNVEPDQAEVWVGVSYVNDTAEEAQSQVNKVMNAILDGLRYEGISEKDIETQSLNLYEERDWTQNEGSKLVGWRATQTLKVKTQDLTKVGPIVDIAVQNGANQINNIQFTLSDTKQQEFKKQAISQATTNAKEKAETIAESLGVKLGDVKTVSEANYYATPYTYAMDAVAGGVAVKEAAAITPSDVTVSANINIVYKVK